MEGKYGDADWYNEIIAEPILPIESSLWLNSFRGDVEEEVDLPYQLAHIWTYLLEVGPVGIGAFGPSPLSFLEINAWLLSTGIWLSHWEILLLRYCSQEWISAQSDARKPGAIPPWIITSPQSIADRRKRVADRLKRLGEKR